MSPELTDALPKLPPHEETSSARPPSTSKQTHPAHGLIAERTRPAVNERQARSAGVRPGRRLSRRARSPLVRTDLRAHPPTE